MSSLRPPFLAALAGLAAVLSAPLAAQEIFSEEDLDAQIHRVLERDAFPVLFDPELASANDGDASLRDDEPVIGLFLNGEARAYPISVMGSHELVNDTCGGVPIAASW